MPTSIPAHGNTLHLGGVCLNRIGTVRTCRLPPLHMTFAVLGEEVLYRAEFAVRRADGGNALEMRTVVAAKAVLAGA
jgi:hypothetical protein